MARACGSYPQCRWFKSDYRYHRSSNRRSNSGPMVKRLRHRPFTAVTRVRFPFGSPLYGRIAQLVRAPASHAGGQRFESVYAHQLRTVHTSVWAVLNLCVITELMPLPPRKAVRPFMSSSQREMRRSQAVRVRLRPPNKSSSLVRVGCFYFMYEDGLMPLPPRKAVRPFSGSSQREMPRSQAVRVRLRPPIKNGSHVSVGRS